MARPPIQRDPRTGVFAVSSHALVRAAMNDPATFASRAEPALADADAATLHELAKQTVPFVATLADADPPDHTRFRALVDGEFAPARVASLVPELEKRCHALVDDFAPHGRCDLRADYAQPLALSAIADRLGVPRADLPLLQRSTSCVDARLTGLAPDEDPLELMRRVLEFQHYFAVRIDEARHAPRDDLLSHLSRARLELGESLSVVQQIIVIGVETTASAIVAGVRAWIERPDLAAQLRRTPALRSGFVEEVLRLASPMKLVKRRAARSAELGGIAIPAGAVVLLEIGAANRDPAVFADPDRIDPARPNAADHLAFGEGIHTCLGAGLARAQLDAAFRVLLERLDGVRRLSTPGTGLSIAFTAR